MRFVRQALHPRHGRAAIPTIVTDIIESLSRHGMHPAIGGSRLLVALGVADDADDWDITVDAPPEEVAAALAASGVTAHPATAQDGIFGTAARFHIETSDAQVDLLVDFAIRGPGGLEPIPTTVVSRWRGLPMADPAAWQRAYELLGRDHKAAILAQWLRENEPAGGDAADLDPVRADRQLGETDWTHRPPGMATVSIPAPSGALAGVEMGPTNAPRVVLVPGATGSKEDFLLLMPLLAAAGYHVEACDLAGHYESAGAGPENLDPPAERYTLDLFVDDLLAVLSRGSAPAHLLGYSFGGIVAATAAVRRPDLVSSLTLLSAPPRPGRSFGGIKYVGWLIGGAGPGLSAAVMMQGLRWNVTGENRARWRFVRQRLRTTRTACVRDIMGLMSHTPDLAEPLRRTGIPTLVAAGTGDLWPVTAHHRFATRVGARCVVYRTGHGPCETTPHQLTADLLRLFRAAQP